MKYNGEKKLDEKSILERLSNGAMLNVCGGQSSSSDDDGSEDELSKCLAGCGCSSQTACTTCKA